MGDRDRIALHIENLCKSYAGANALNGVTLSLRQGEVHVLLGVDGSGKSTLVKILSGVERPDFGLISIGSSPVNVSSPRVAARLGIGVVHHESSLVPSMSVIDNILLNYLSGKRRWGFPVIDWIGLHKTIQEVLDLMEVKIDLQQRAKDLTLAQQQVVKIAKALCIKPSILLLDEPTRGLTEIDVSQLFRVISTLIRRGTSVLYVSSRPDEIPHVADRVSVIKEGKILGTMPADETNLRSVVEMLVAETSQVMALREADRLRREFVSLVSHELRTPLAIIRGYAETVMSRPWSEEIRKECLEAITSGCDRLTELVDNLLDISSLEKGILRIEQEPLWLPDLAERLVKAKQRKIQRGTLTTVNFPLDFPVVYADPKRIEQVLHNLIDNAVKYSLQGSTIMVSGVVDKEYGGVVITVEDEGMGIPPEHLTRVFERFYRVPNHERAGIEGSGLGLPICKGIIESHGGRIWAKSTPGRGSAFSFSLPLALELVENGSIK